MRGSGGSSECPDGAIKCRRHATSNAVRASSCRSSVEVPMGDLIGRALTAGYANNSITRDIAGCFRFFTLTQCFDRPA
jgi:hypothetical protein